LASLAIVAAFGIPKIAREVTGTSAAAPCQLATVPAPLKWSLAQVENAVRSSGLRSLIDGGSRDTEGVQQPNAAWSDGYPAVKPATDPSITPAAAGYELRWWTAGRHDHQGADLFVFATARDARQYVQQAGSARCRTGATSRVLAQPVGARALVWTNPEGYLQADVLFSRANRAYRLVEVPPPGPRLNRSQLIKIPQKLGCQLPDAVCRGT